MCEKVEKLLTCGVVVTLAVSVLLFVLSTFFRVSSDVFSLDSSAILHGNVHKLFTYSFVHEDVVVLLLSSGVLVLFGGGLERSLGTVRFLHHLFLLPVCTGLLYTLLEVLLYNSVDQTPVQGLVPATLTLVGVATTHSLMQWGVLLGVRVPTASLPWVLSLVAYIVPGTTFLCNILAVAVGQIYGKGWVGILNLSETRASVLDKKMLFRLLKKLVWAIYLPASAEERRKILHPPCKPVPGSYPVQAYAPVAPGLPLQTESGLLQMYEGWQHSSYAQVGHNPQSFLHGHGHGHGHWHAAATSWSGSHWTQGNSSADSQNYTSTPLVFPAEPKDPHSLLIASGGFIEHFPGPPYLNMSSPGAHTLPSSEREEGRTTYA
ncbi:hypothetical protein GN956_G576 [Arapaima gigas]